MTFPVFIAYAASKDAVALNDQHDPQTPWLLTGGNLFLQSTDLGRTGASYKVLFGGVNDSWSIGVSSTIAPR